MKKILKTFCSLSLTFGLFAGCADIDSENSKKNNSENLTRKEELAFYALSNNYILTESEMESNLRDFLTIDTVKSRSAQEKSDFELIQSAKDVIKIEDNYNISRSASISSYDDVNLYMYKLNNKKTGKEGFAITSTDRRIGNIIAVIPEGTLEDNNSPFIEMFLDNLQDYVDETVDIWNELDDDYLNDFSGTHDIGRSTESNIVTSGNFSYKNWKFNSGNINNFIKVNWGQDSPYNDVICTEKGKYYYTGCGPTALAQLLSNIEFPKTCSVEGYKNIRYDWPAMKKNSHIYSLDANTRKMIATLMYELGLGLNASYSVDGTGCYNSDITSYLSKNNYYYSGFDDYNLSGVKNSIDAGYPVLCQGYAFDTVTKTKIRKKIFGITYKTTTKINHNYSSGHYWIVDGYANLTCSAVNKNTSAETTLKADFVHCNLGWSGSCNGYYLNGVFDTNHLPTSTINGRASTSGESYFYQYNLKMLTKLHH